MFSKSKKGILRSAQYLLKVEIEVERVSFKFKFRGNIIGPNSDIAARRRI